MGKMNPILTVPLLWLCTLAVQAQTEDGIGIGTSNVDADAILEIESADKGVLLPRVTDVPASPADGMVLYNNNTNSLYARENGRWYDVFPRGGIIMWSGDPDNLPDGWALCDGTNGTPDLRGRFIVGYHAGSNASPTNSLNLTENYGQVGNTGGKANDTLKTSQIPSHTHSIPGHNHNISLEIDAVPAHTHDIFTRLDESGGSAQSTVQRTHGGVQGGNSVTYQTNPDGGHNHSFDLTLEGTDNGSTGAQGGSQPHENRPPYYVLAFIMKL